MGGNSVKATSGINGALTKTQIKAGIKDSAELFEADTIKSAAGLGGTEAPAYTAPLAHVLTHESGPAVDWLCGSFGLDLSLVSRLGGHSQPRTHRGAAKFPGFTITYALMEKLEEIEEQSKGEQARILNKATVTELLRDGAGAVVGVRYSKEGKQFTELGPVVIATGGFAADFSPTGILAKVRPDLMHLPTTNGEHCTGDGIKMALSAGAATVDMVSVQVHPTGLVHPDEPDAKVKFLAAEALRGVGGIMLDSRGQRFVDEMEKRDYVTDKMNKNTGPFRLVLNEAAAHAIEWHCKHYKGRGLMKAYPNSAALAADMGLPPAVLAKTLSEYNTSAAKGAPDAFGTRFYANAPVRANEELHVAVITPVVHYCMGGLAISPCGEVLSEATGKPIPGLYAAGEVAGGIHGRNRLGGNSLLDCVVFGRVSGAAVSRTLFQDALKRVRAGAAAPRLAPAPTAAAAAAAAGPITAEQVAQHASDKDCWVILNGKVYDVTAFLPDHPGGKKAIVLYAGKDASEEFNMLHSARPPCPSGAPRAPLTSPQTQTCSQSTCPHLRAWARWAPPARCERNKVSAVRQAVYIQHCSSLCVACGCRARRADVWLYVQTSLVPHMHSSSVSTAAA